MGPTTPPLTSPPPTPTPKPPIHSQKMFIKPVGGRNSPSFPQQNSLCYLNIQKPQLSLYIHTYIYPDFDTNEIKKKQGLKRKDFRIKGVCFKKWG